jgi:hypothetical protein
LLLGGVAAYSSPPPDAAGSFNTSQYDEKGWWEEQTHGLLTDGAYGNQDIKLKNVPTYRKSKKHANDPAYHNSVDSDFFLNSFVCTFPFC